MACFQDGRMTVPRQILPSIGALIAPMMAWRIAL